MNLFNHSLFNLPDIMKTGRIIDCDLRSEPVRKLMSNKKRATDARSFENRLD